MVFVFSKKIDDYIEIYSLFVTPLFRQKGIAKNIFRMLQRIL